MSFACRRRTGYLLSCLFAFGMLTLGTAGCAWAQQAAGATDAAALLPRGLERPWIGPAFWANPMMDWKLKNGRIVCHSPGVDHDVHLTTHQLKPEDGQFTMSVRIAIGKDASGDSFAGFKFAITGHAPTDWRANLFHNKSLRAGIMPDGRLLLGEKHSEEAVARVALSDVTLVLTADCKGDRASCTLRAFAGADTSIAPLATLAGEVTKDPLCGNLALACEQLSKNGKGAITAEFRDWKVSGNKIAVHPEQTFGPILWTQYTLSERVLKLMVHMAPIAETDARDVLMQTRQDGDWVTIAKQSIDPLSRTALFRVNDWDATRDTPYRIRYVSPYPIGGTCDWEGTIARDPRGDDSVALAVFTGLGSGAFPNTDLVETVRKHEPDILFFSGDQVYEGNGGYWPVAHSNDGDVPRATLNYLSKLWLWGWTFRDLLKDRPSILTTDDHDVWSNDLWGRGGALRQANRCAGGYNHPKWVNMVEHTQMGHLPDPPDPRPILNGINVHYTQVKYGGVSIAVLEDRKFKSAPTQVLDKPIGHTNMNNLESIMTDKFDAAALDKPGLTLLGERQLKFLNNWVADWRGVDFKAVVSGSPFAVCHQGYGNMVADLDSNGWPQTGRNRALRIIRKGFAVMAAGDLHLANLFQHGVDEFRDGPWSYSCPSSAAVSLRVWRPKVPGMNRKPGAPRDTGDFTDALGNRITVEAVLNPNNPFVRSYRKRDGSKLDHYKMACSGFGILRFRRKDMTITFESWPIYDAETPVAEHRQHPRWPKTVPVTDNYNRTPAAWLPTLRIKGMERPVLEVIREDTGELVYARRLATAELRPPVFAQGRYTVRIGEPGTTRVRILKGLSATQKPGETVLSVDLSNAPTD
jgi:alkaline phosphatase D